MGQLSSSNYKQGRFQNLVPSHFARPAGGGIPLLKEFLFGKAERVPVTPPEQTKLKVINKLEKKLLITWLGHSTVLIQLDRSLILTDPMFSHRASPVSFLGPVRFNRELPLELDALPTIDAVVISHDHYDHLDKATIKTLHPRVKEFFVPLGVGNHLRAWGVPREKIHELDWWGESRSQAGVSFIATPARHFSGRGLKRNNTLWASWVIAGQEHRLYFSGDGGYSDTFKEIGEQFGPFAVTLMECGQYNESWADMHMLPEESVQAHIDLRGEIMLPIHWGVFSISLHSWNEPIQRARNAARENHVNIATPQIGGSLMYNTKIPAETWWEEVSTGK
ncbi:MAG: hypothetical protein FH749_14670 [Firmicutes bacterium]|nr:hypothetical protein [Bacillota bacterium]